MFPQEFLWGAATSAYQIEGAVREDGRGASIWDTFSHASGATRNGDNGDIACDHFHRFEDDVALMARLGIRAYRFSIAWPRVQPEGVGTANERGLDFYRRLVDSLQRHGITPVATLYHWDLPQALEDRGGWTNRDTAMRFAEYAGIVHRSLQGSIPMWITVNEPWVSAWLGYGSGVHAPGLVDDAKALAASHHLLLAHGLAMEAMRAPGGERVGITLNLQPVRPASDGEEDARVAFLADLHMNDQYLDPVFGRGYPAPLVDHYRDVSDLAFVHDGDLDVLSRPMDFLGINYYTRHTVAATAEAQPMALELPGHLGAWAYPSPVVPATLMNWGIEPDGLTDILLRVSRDYPKLPLYVMENGAAFDDYADPEARVQDASRVAYLRDHLIAAGRAIDAGVDLAGYFAWSFLDNFEWAEGFGRRFGLVYVDYPTQTRIPKTSAHWFGEVASSRGASLS